LHPAGDELRCRRGGKPAIRQANALACALHDASSMQHTTPALESIDTDALLLVSGGCGGRRGKTIIINNNNCGGGCGTPSGPPTPTLGAPGTPVATAPSDPQTIVTTNVSINGQPIGQAPTATG